MKILAIIVTGSLVNLLSALVLAYPFMLLWNSSVVPALKVASEVGYLQSACILILTYIVRAAAAKVEAKE